MKKYCEFYDSYYEIKTGFFTENLCFDKHCAFCHERPDIHPKNCQCLDVKDKK